MRIRRYMVMGVLSIIVFPWFVYFVIHMFDTHPWQTRNGVAQPNLTQTIQFISQNQENWANPNWQKRLNSTLHRENLDAVIRSPSNQVIFASPQHRHPHWMSNQQVTVVKDGKLAGTVELSQPGKADPYAAAGAVLAAVFAVLFVGTQMGRNVIRPLESMSRAALQIAEGDLDFELAASKTMEIQQVRNAFQVMVHGLRDAFAKQQKLEEERRFFIGAIAHDLRSPLFSLRGYLEGMEQGIAASPEKIAHYVAMCKEKASHLDRLVSDLFAFTRLEYMEQTLQQEDFDLSEVLDRTVESFLYTAREKQIHLRVNKPDEECLVAGDTHLLERAITNLLDNAVRYTPINGQVTIELQQETDKIILQIRDTGPGFSTAEVHRVFEPMYRGDTSRNLHTGGAGLGLTIARRIFRSHGGELSAENGRDGGAVLTGWIPKTANQE